MPGDTRFSRFIGIDWSGAKGRRQRGIAVATCGADGCCTLAPPPGGGAWSREAVLGFLEAQPAGTLAGLDFAFSLPWPAAGPLPPGLPQPADARGLWSAVDAICRDEPHLYAGPAYHPEGGWLAAYMFTKLTGRSLWSGPSYATDRLRRVEMTMSPRPNAVFKIVGPKTVGPGSFAGMRMLSVLDRRLGDRLAVWPFDPPDPKALTLVEIYPSFYFVCGGQRRSTDPDILRAVFERFGTVLQAGPGPLSQDEADALVGAAALRYFAGLSDPFPQPADVPADEGWIFGVPPG